MCLTIDLGLSASRTVRNRFWLVITYSVRGICYSKSKQTKTGADSGLKGKKKSESEISRVNKILLISYYFKMGFKAILQVPICNIKTKPKL